MTLAQLWQWWDTVFFKPVPATAMGLYRICFGLTVIQFCILLYPELTVWYGSKGVVSVETARAATRVPCVNILSYLPSADDAWVLAFFAVFALAAVMSALGLFSRAAVFVCWLGFASFHHRNLYNINSGDVLMTLSAFYLFFSPCGEAFSLDRLLRVWLRKDADVGAERQFSPWAQRLLQLQMATIYCQATLSKLAGAPWVDGTALYWVLRQKEFWRFPIPFVPDNLLLCKLMSWFTLVIEGSMFTLVWVRELRYFVLAGIILLHAGIDYAMNLPMFETLMIASLLSFVYPEDFSRAMDWLKARINKSDPLPLVYNGKSLFALRVAQTIRRLDVLGRISLVDYSESGSFKGKTTFRPESLSGGLAIYRSDRWTTGLAAVRMAAPCLPLMWIAYPLLFLPGLAAAFDRAR